MEKKMQHQKEGNNICLNQSIENARLGNEFLHWFLPHPCPAIVYLDQAVKDGHHRDPGAHHLRPHSQLPSPPPRSRHTSRSALGSGCERQAPPVW